MIERVGINFSKNCACSCNQSYHIHKLWWNIKSLSILFIINVLKTTSLIFLYNKISTNLRIEKNYSQIWQKLV